MCTRLLFIVFVVLAYTVGTTVRVKNKGGYLARFFVDYQTNKSYWNTKESGIFPVSESREIKLPYAAEHARSRIEIMMYPPDSFEEIVRYEFINNHTTGNFICIDIWGIIWFPRWSFVNC
ncbi:unnamed protein product [Didymodactylos carnosus]|uniref:Uncharacterized protein n=1 Tax=Didymodactylos carnosus TaxID=1234261 RepID=A0A813U775_9BILA|nr:unnamed protein product [Didymodactylos carnosus]CAF1357897.1 unnamed protein product [Didymodactylos carnosus]CAF3606068.1 unnamed protein product [Didymodactylos carnosus]CAF4168275.1 unnamed protein product [Didymodactylos carnosus]